METLCHCRVCLSSTSREYIELEALLSNGKTYLECFNSCTQLTAMSGDKLPSMLCTKCANDLQKAYEFIVEARKADNVLRNRLNGEKLVQVLSPENDAFKDADIENMEIVVIKSTDDQIIESALSEEKKDNEANIIDQYSYGSENETDHILEISEQEAITTHHDSSWKCRECKRLFDSSVPYEDHMNWHRKLHTFQCRECSTIFRTQKALLRHSNLRHKTTSDDDIQQHKKQTHDDNVALMISCTHCIKNFTSTEMLQLHERLEHSSINSTSPKLCHKTVISNNSQESDNHIRLEHSIEDKLYDSFVEDLIEHCETENSDDDIKSEDPDKVSTLQECTFCKKKLLSRNMDKHMKLHTKRQDYFLCAYCPRHFKNQKSFRQHEKTHFEESEDIIYVCTACDRQFATMSLLDQHRKNTHKEREHICTICGNAFKLRNQLNNHMKLHLEKNIQCPHCDKKYARQFDLKIHLRSHTGEMPYQCHLCEKRFSIKVHLTYHLQKHYGIKHTCKECGAQFNSKQKLKAHSFKHTGMPYRCEICDNHGFPNRDVFKRHLIRVHHATISEEALLEMFQRFTGKTTKIREVSNVSLEGEIEMNNQETVSLNGEQNDFTHNVKIK